jgi:O-methyltransferase
MMGMGALNNLHDCLHEVVLRDIPGDFVETGVWRGGGTIYMRGFLEIYGVADRNVWVCDSFEGLPKPSGKYEADKGDTLWQSDYLAVSQDKVADNFRFYGLLDDHVKFLKGFFCDTMPTAPIEQIALLRLDGDMYESTIDVLTHLYPRLSQGGIVIIDDYGMVPGCDRAVHEYRNANRIEAPLEFIGYVRGKPLGAYWRKS